MRIILKPAHRSMLVRPGILLLFLLCMLTAAGAQARPDFSGMWKQENDRCQPKHNGDVTLRIEHHDPKFTVETTISRASASSRHTMQEYTTDGKVSISTGTDGDEFHSSVVWKDSSLVFSIEEHEEGRILRSKETWSLIEDGATLERTREHPDGDKQVLFFRRQQPTSTQAQAEGDLDIRHQTTVVVRRTPTFDQTFTPLSNGNNGRELWLVISKMRRIPTIGTDIRTLNPATPASPWESETRRETQLALRFALQARTRESGI